jgi:hypothetical protein
MTKDEALRLALEALEWQQEMLYTAMQYSAAKGMTFLGHPPNPNEAITAIKAALEAKDEPVAWMNQNGVVRKVGYEWGPNNTLTALYATPPQRTWVGLTDEEIVLIVAECAASHQHTDIHFAKAIEAKLKEKNT